MVGNVARRSPRFLHEARFQATGSAHADRVCGGLEILRALKRDGVMVNLEIGKGMFHCYPFFPIVSETKEAWNRMIGCSRQ